MRMRQIAVGLFMLLCSSGLCVSSNTIVLAYTIDPCTFCAEFHNTTDQLRTDVDLSTAVFRTTEPATLTFVQMHNLNTSFYTNIVERQTGIHSLWATGQARMRLLLRWCARKVFLKKKAIKQKSISNLCKEEDDALAVLGMEE